MIRFHWRLVTLSPELGDYAAAYELAHLWVMNHSPRFREAAEGVVSDYRRLRPLLRAAACGSAGVLRF